MSFASSWLEKGTLFPALINEAPDPETGIIVVVPAFNELYVPVMLNSLAKCKNPACKTEVIIIINAASDTSPEKLRNNLRAFNDIEEWKEKNRDCFFRIHPVDLGQPAMKGWGVGMARKSGMDEATRRFNTLCNPGGVILNLDADCTVQSNYFISVEKELLNKKDKKGCSIYFEHRVSGNDFPQSVYDSAYQYELHLRYYFQALTFTGFPNVFHTVGSSIAVKALPYIKAGGMNRRQAGEDFYFVQKLVPAGGYFSLNSTSVYPSSRVSDRVPFGTGAAIGKMISGDSIHLLTYNPLAFIDLFFFFQKTEKLFSCNSDNLDKLINEFPESIKQFLAEQEWVSRVTEIKNNTSGYDSFRKRFFEWFNMFKVVKFLNFSHKFLFQKVPVSVAAEELLRYLGLLPGNMVNAGLLQFYRGLEKKS